MTNEKDDLSNRTAPRTCDEMRAALERLRVRTQESLEEIDAALLHARRAASPRDVPPQTD